MHYEIKLVEDEPPEKEPLDYTAEPMKISIKTNFWDDLIELEEMPRKKIGVLTQIGQVIQRIINQGYIEGTRCHECWKKLRRHYFAEALNTKEWGKLFVMPEIELYCKKCWKKKENLEFKKDDKIGG